LKTDDMQGKKKALGRGLSALLENPETDITSRELSSDHVIGAIAQIEIALIEPNPFQPRVHFDKEELADLALSIQQQGIIQPVTVRKIGIDRYQLISGERRLKAARVAGLTEVPAYIRVANDEQMLEMALVENIQREDLNPLEVAISFQRLLDECQIRQEDLSVKVGKDRSTISNYIRLLRLPAEIQGAIRDNRITMGHARALITIDDPEKQVILLGKILDRKLSVRQVEELVRNMNQPAAEKKQAGIPQVPQRYRQTIESLNQKMNTAVHLRVNNKGAGSLTIPFRNEDELNRIIALLD